MLWNALTCYKIQPFSGLECSWFISYTFTLRNWNGCFQDAVYISNGSLRWRITQTYCTQMLHALSVLTSLQGHFISLSKVTAIKNREAKILFRLVTNALKSIRKTTWNSLVTWCAMKSIVSHILSENNIVKILSTVLNVINIGWKQSFISCGILLVKVVYVDFTFPRSLYPLLCSFWNSLFGENSLFKLLSTWIYLLWEMMN